MPVYQCSSAPALPQAAFTCPSSIVASSLGDEAVVLQNSCLPSTSGPLPSNKVHTGAPPNAKQWTIQGGLRDNATLQLSYGMIFCYNVTWLLLAMVVSLLPLAAGVIAIYTLPAHIAQNLAASAGACNSPTYLNAYQYTPFEMGHLVADTAAWCEVQADHCNTNSFFTQISHRVYEQADPAAAKFVGSAERRVVPCHANDCAHFDDDMPSSLPRCVENASRSDGAQKCCYCCAIRASRG